LIFRDQSLFKELQFSGNPLQEEGVEETKIAFMIILYFHTYIQVIYSFQNTF